MIFILFLILLLHFFNEAIFNVINGGWKIFRRKEKILAMELRIGPLDGYVYKLGKETQKGNYGGYLILKHKIKKTFYSLMDTLKTSVNLLSKVIYICK